MFDLENRSFEKYEGEAAVSSRGQFVAGTGDLPILDIDPNFRSEWLDRSATKINFDEDRPIPGVNGLLGGSCLCC